MKILFICGSLEPGRDGVGDYTRRLVVEFIRLGHTAQILGLNDSHLFEPFSGVQQSEEYPVTVLRLPQNITYKNRILIAKRWIEEFNPDCLSLQFVPFSFNKKGLPFGLANFLKSLGNKRSWHIMAHELWIGMDTQSSLKFKVWGWLQRQIIRTTFRKLHPKVIHTQAQVYSLMLKEIGITSYMLPLFGNIPLLPYTKKALNKCVNAPYSNKIIIFAVFGSIHKGAPIGVLADELYQLRSQMQIDFILKFIGRCGPEQNRWVEEWENAGLKTVIIGEQTANIVSLELSNSTFGLSSTPLVLVEKSGSVAAMKEHGLPVLCVSANWYPRGIKILPTVDGVTCYKKGDVSKFVTKNHKTFSDNDISAVTEKFIHDLKAYN